jgi:molybdenum cofactor biosynthesis protein MoaC
MIDVGNKPTTLRAARARAVLFAGPESIQALREGRVPKGDPLEVARAVAALAVKNTPQWIPYCHPIRIDWVGFEHHIHDDRITLEVSVRAVDRTGVEVEAMAGASAAVLVVYDMLKMLDDTLSIGGIELLEKRGGKSDFRKLRPERITAGVLVMSDSIAAGFKEDTSGRVIRERLEHEGLAVQRYAVVPDDSDQIVSTLLSWIDDDGIQLVLTTGGTCFGPRDNTPEAMRQVIEREAPGMVETARSYGQARTPFSMLSRGLAGMRGGSLIVNLPGSKGGVTDSLDALMPGVVHAFRMLRGEGHDDASGNREPS